MNTLSEISELLLQKDNFIIIPHKNPDGDCLGSSAALLTALRDIGKTAYISLPNMPGAKLMYLWENDFSTPDGFECDVCIAVDVAADYMMGELKQKIFDKAPLTVCLDHHGTNNGLADINYIDASAAAAGEVIYMLVCLMNAPVSKKCAEALYSAIASDTGSFQYSNTTARTHTIAAELLNVNIDSAKIMRILFETKTLNQARVMSDIIDNMEFFMDGRLCITHCDEAMLAKYGLTFDEIDEYIGLPRSIAGVEIGIFLKCYSDDETKVSLRSNEYADVSALAASLGGGGHIRAAGVTIHGNKETAKATLINEAKKIFE